jgi:glucose-1-phosphate thymidylyltransferase
MKSNEGLSNQDSFSKQGNVKINHPVFIGENVIFKDSTIGPYVSIGDNCIISDSNIESTLIYNNVKVSNATIQNSILGSNSVYDGSNKEIFLGDYSQINNDD